MVAGFGQAYGPPGYLIQFDCSLGIGAFLDKSGDLWGVQRLRDGIRGVWRGWSVGGS